MAAGDEKNARKNAEASQPKVVEGAAGEQQEQARSGGNTEDTAKAVEEAARQSDELRDTGRAVAQATAEAQAAQGPQESAGSDDEHPLVLGVDNRPLEGVPTFLESLAGNSGTYDALVVGDPYAFEDNPGAHLPDGTIAHGTPVPTVVGAYREARARLGIPEPIRVDRSSGTTLLDTPGGQQMVPAGWTPTELANEQTYRQTVRGNPASFPAGEETGARERHIGGRPLDQKGEDHPASK